MERGCASTRKSSSEAAVGSLEMLTEHDLNGSENRCFHNYSGDECSGGEPNASLNSENYSMLSDKAHSMDSLLSDTGAADGGMHCVVDDTYQQTVLSQASADKELPDNPTVRVLKHLNKILGDKVNEELEEFGNSLQSLLSQQFAQVSHLVSISNVNRNACSQEKNSSQDELKEFNQPLQNLTANENDCAVLCDKHIELEDFNKSQCLLRMLVTANRITDRLNQITCRT